eukprot:5277180-Amphidinium_carterae.1
MISQCSKQSFSLEPGNGGIQPGLRTARNSQLHMPMPQGLRVELAESNQREPVPNPVPQNNSTTIQARGSH